MATTKRKPAATQSSQSEPTVNITQEQLDALLAKANAKPAGVWSPPPYLIALALCGVIVLIGIYYHWTQNQGGTDRVDRADTKIAKEIQAVFPDRDSAEAFRSSCKLMAKLVEEDGKCEQPSLTKREQISEVLLANFAGTWILWGTDPSSDSALQELLANRFDEESEFPQKAGPLTDEDRAKAVKQFKALAR